MKRLIRFGELFGAMSKSKAPKECLVRVSDSLHRHAPENRRPVRNPDGIQRRRVTQ